MIKYIVAALCLVAIAEAGVISSAQVSRTAIHPFGPVEGIMPCPMAGVIVEVRVPDCTRVPCELNTGDLYALEIVFRPAGSHPGLNIRVVITHLGQSFEVINGPVENSAVEAGQTYTLTYPITVEGFFLGESDLRVELHGRSSGTVEICGIAGILVHP